MMMMTYDNNDNLPLVRSLLCSDPKPDSLSTVLFCLAHLFSSSLLHTILAHLVGDHHHYYCTPALSPGFILSLLHTCFFIISLGFKIMMANTILAHLVDITIYDDDCDDIDIWNHKWLYRFLVTKWVSERSLTWPYSNPLRCRQPPDFRSHFGEPPKIHRGCCNARPHTCVHKNQTIWSGLASSS